MSFVGGDIGAPAAIIDAAVISRPAGSFDADGNWLTDDTPGQPSEIKNLRLQYPELDANIGGWDIANNDSGILVSQAPQANEHGLPLNFGPGRGQWDALAVGRVVALINQTDGTTTLVQIADTLFRNGVGGIVLDAGGTDVEIGFHSMGGAAARAMTITLLYLAESL